jgi:hypothetical protein
MPRSREPPSERLSSNRDRTIAPHHAVESSISTCGVGWKIIKSSYYEPLPHIGQVIPRVEIPSAVYERSGSREYLSSSRAS